MGPGPGTDGAGAGPSGGRGQHGARGRGGGGREAGGRKEPVRCGRVLGAGGPAGTSLAAGPCVSPQPRRAGGFRRGLRPAAGEAGLSLAFLLPVQPPSQAGVLVTRAGETARMVAEQQGQPRPCPSN